MASLIGIAKTGKAIAAVNRILKSVSKNKPDGTPDTLETEYPDSGALRRII